MASAAPALTTTAATTSIVAASPQHVLQQAYAVACKRFISSTTIYYPLQATHLTHTYKCPCRLDPLLMPLPHAREARAQTRTRGHDQGSKYVIRVCAQRWLHHRVIAVVQRVARTKRAVTEAESRARAMNGDERQRKGLERRASQYLLRRCCCRRERACNDWRPFTAHANH